MSNPLADFSHCSLPSTFVGIPSKRTSMTTTTGHLQTFIEHKEEGLQQRKDLASAKELSAVLLKEFKNFQSLLQDEQKHGSKKRKFFDDLSDTDSDNSNNTIQLNSFNAKIDFNTLVKSSLLHMQQRANQSFSSLTLTELSPKSFHGNHNSATTGNITPPAPSKKYTKKPKKPSITKELSNGTQLYKLNGIILDFKIPKNNAKTNAFHQAWKIHFDQLVDFRNRYGHTNVTRCTEGFEELGSWVSEQRRKLKNGKVTLEQFELLNQAGFEWDRSYYFHNTYKPNSEAEVQKSEKSPQQERQSSNIGAEALLSLAQPSGQQLPPVFPFK